MIIDLTTTMKVPEPPMWFSPTHTPTNWQVKAPELTREQISTDEGRAALAKCMVEPIRRIGVCLRWP